MSNKEKPIIPEHKPWKPNRQGPDKEPYNIPDRQGSDKEPYIPDRDSDDEISEKP